MRVTGRMATALAVVALTGSGSSVSGREPAGDAAAVIRPEAVRAHEMFLASDALQGRGSATRDEAIAAAYVASQFAGFGLSPAPGMDGYLQTATVVRPRLDGPATLAVGGKPVSGMTLLFSGPDDVAGQLGIARTADGSDMPLAPLVVATTSGAPIQPLMAAAIAKGVRLLILPESVETQTRYRTMGGRTTMLPYLEGVPTSGVPAIATLPVAEIARLAARAGTPAALTLAGLVRDRATTTNAIGYVPGTDPQAGVLLVSAHLDHLGVRGDGAVMHGANDDASGTVAVIELARTLSAGRRPRRGILFVCYGSEEIGGYGSRWFAAHSPVPLSSIVANLEIEMIGAQDPKLPPGAMMMTGYDRSNLGPALKAHGALVVADPYPEQNFFRRSDNYSLALKGVVAHTVSGWAVTPTYHQPTDTLANIDITFMTRAIQSLVEPLRWMATDEFTPEWTASGRPSE